jgi:pimeloyl-ACP methyl ester carboxylesterase
MISTTFKEQKALVRRCSSTNTDIELAFHSFGDSTNPCVLLVSGLGVQCLMYDEQFCQLISERGFFVVRYDNRDVGYSTKFDHLSKQPLLLHAVLPESLVPWGSVPYSLEDMALDGIALLDYLGVQRANVVGCSMGGMLVQVMATLHPNRVASATSIVSHTGSGKVIQPSWRMKLLMLKRPASSAKEDIIAHRTRMLTAMGGSRVAAHTGWLRERSESVVNRSTYIKGSFRQMVAILSARNREPLLRKCMVPMLVIHGDEDPLIPVENGYRTAAIMPNATLAVVHGMGHVILPEHFQHVSGLIVDHIIRSQTKNTH